MFLWIKAVPELKSIIQRWISAVLRSPVEAVYVHPVCSFIHSVTSVECSRKF